MLQWGWCHPGRGWVGLESVLNLDPWTLVHGRRCAWISDPLISTSYFAHWMMTTYSCLNYIVFMLMRYVTLWPWPLPRWSWKVVVHQASPDRSLYEIWVKYSNPWLNYWEFCEFLHTLCHALTLTFDVLTLNFYSTSGVMHWNSVHNLNEIEYNLRMSYWRFSTFLRCNLRGSGTFNERFSRVRHVRGPNFTKLVEDIGQSLQLIKFFLDFRYLAAFSNAGGQSWVMLKTTPNFALLTPLPVKIREGVGEISGVWMK